MEDSLYTSQIGVEPTTYSLGGCPREDFERPHFDHWTEKGVQRFQKAQKMKAPKPGVVDYDTFIAFAKVMRVYHDHWMGTKK